MKTFTTKNSTYVVLAGLCVEVRKGGRPVDHPAVGEVLYGAIGPDGGVARPGEGTQLVFGDGGGRMKLVTSAVLSAA